MADASFVLLDDRGILAVSGPDRRPFLQGLVSNDVDKVSPTAARYAALLTAQGKYLHDFIMVEAGESIWLDAEAARLGDLKRRLSMYRLRAKVMLDERSEFCVAAIFGADTPAALGLSSDPGAARPFGSGVAFVDPRLAALGARAILPRESARALLADAGFAEAGFDSYDRLRLSLGIPDGSRDLVLEKSILLEFGLRRTERRRLAEGLLYRPGIDGPDQVSRPHQETADACPDRGDDPPTGDYRDHGWARGW